MKALVWHRFIIISVHFKPQPAFKGGEEKRQSSDLKPVEKLWAILKDDVYAPTYCRTIQQLTYIPKETYAGLVDSYWTSRTSKVIIIVINLQEDNNFK